MQREGRAERAVGEVGEGEGGEEGQRQGGFGAGVEEVAPVCREDLGRGGGGGEEAVALDREGSCRDGRSAGLRCGLRWLWGVGLRTTSALADGAPLLARTAEECRCCDADCLRYAHGRGQLCEGEDAVCVRHDRARSESWGVRGNGLSGWTAEAAGDALGSCG